MVPVGSVNAGAASVLSGQVAKDVCRKRAFRAIAFSPLPTSVTSADDAAPIRIAYLAITASTGKVWPMAR
jgi:pilus assembly protein CpaD